MKLGRVKKKKTMACRKKSMGWANARDWGQIQTIFFFF
jgi:hypothetical protein